MTYPKNVQGYLARSGVGGNCYYHFMYGDIYGVTYAKIVWFDGSPPAGCGSGVAAQGLAPSGSQVFAYQAFAQATPFVWRQATTSTASAISGCFEYGQGGNTATARRAPW